MVSRPEISLTTLLKLSIGNPQKGLNEIKIVSDGDAAWARPKSTSPLNDIKIYGEVSFTHKLQSYFYNYDSFP